MTSSTQLPEKFDRKALAQHAQELHDRNFNCAQSVICTFAPCMGADEDLAFRLAEGLGGGLGGHTETCGALLGAAMSVSLARSSGYSDPTSKTATYALVAPMAETFREKHGTTVCEELRAQDMSGETPLPICLACIDDAVELAADALERLRGEQAEEQ